MSSVLSAVSESTDGGKTKALHLFHLIFRKRHVVKEKNVKKKIFQAFVNTEIKLENASQKSTCISTIVMGAGRAHRHFLQ